MFIINRIVFVLNCLVILLLLASCLAPFITPELSWHIAFLGLAYPVLFVLNVLFIIYWAVFLNLKFMFSLAAIIIGWNYVPRFVQVSQKKAAAEETGMISVLSFNARYFGIYDKMETSDDELFSEKLDKINPDVLCLQEFSTWAFKADGSITSSFRKKYKKFYRANISESNGEWFCNNIGILSRYPICKKGIVEHDSSSGNYTIYADIVKGSDTVRVIATHLQSIGFEKKDYEAVKHLENEIEPVELKRYKSIASKIKWAFLMRSKQADAIKEFVDKTSHRIILCGDFNDSPTSYAYRTIKGDMKDGFMESGSGLGRTYVGAMPSLRIDYILGDPSFAFYNYYSKSFDFSDHKMISCSVKIR